MLSIAGLRDLARLVALFALLAMVVAYLNSLFSDEYSGRAHVLDGDSLRIAETEIRLEGIDAPEFGQICRDATGEGYDCGDRAKRALQQLVGGTIVTCQSAHTDRYGRALSVCWAENPDDALNEAMVRSGWAVSYGGYAAVERDARLRKVGLWAGSFEAPRDFRARRSDAVQTPWFMRLLGVGSDDE
ncbi:MAG: thermonuclease family protein [Pseudomonadota bacterium]